MPKFIFTKDSPSQIVTYTLFHLVLVSRAQALPSLEDVTAAKCENDRPFKCLPYGTCCRGDQFCFKGACESCFPAEKDLLHWCQTVGLHNVSEMRDVTCSLACQARFTVNDLAHFQRPVTEGELGSDKQKDDQWYHRFMAMCIVSVVFCCSTITFLTLLCYSLFGRSHSSLRHRTLARESLPPRLTRRQCSRRSEYNEDGTIRYSDLTSVATSSTYAQCGT
ncbi:hypothetical protein Bpfe_009441 [Biomphalaria pfeifferi]|uniref:Uncharacterized protein n=1 Tax=Biomphalaria pfeifferi TaxID=112525 RepID=A0AAD8FEB8_BIOPF|nr:hypothetical protein Bpfe_009441 [Biomphalaria pfeifferi]